LENSEGNREEGREGSHESRGRKYPNDERRDKERSPRRRERRSPVGPIRGLINTISIGFERGRVSSLARKKHVVELKA